MKNSVPEDNLTRVMEFILLGFSDLPNLQGFLLGIFLVIYLSILIGNGLLIFITRTDPTLQTPMYFFLGNFSFLEICYICHSPQNAGRSLDPEENYIIRRMCCTSLFPLYSGVAECLLLTVMACNRYVAVCKPLCYPLIMNHKVCTQMVVASWMIGVPVLIEQTYQIFSLNFCGLNKINHIFCDCQPLFKLVCGKTYQILVSTYIVTLIFILSPFLLIITSYVKVRTTILKLPLISGRSNAFSTCSSHIIFVGLFCESACIVYFSPESSESGVSNKILSPLYTTVTPMFNRLIYSLRNKDVIAAMIKLLSKCSRS